MGIAKRVAQMLSSQQAGTRDITGASAEQLAQAAYEEFERGGHGATVSQSGYSFDQWVYSNPVGQWYAIKIMRKLLEGQEAKMGSEDDN